MSRLRLIAACSGALLALLAPAMAHADDLMIYRPVTAAGGAPVDPTFWNQQAAVRFTGGAAAQTNVTLSPSASTFYDYSQRPTTIEGGQTNVSATSSLANGGSVYVSTQHDPTFSGNAQQQNSSTGVSSTATLGNGSTVSTSATTN